MPVKKQIPYSSGHFFITFTCYKWLPLIEIANGYESVYKWFDYLKKQGHFITGYVLMPNHIHATIAFRKTAKSINRIVGEGKRFIAYEIVKLLTAGNHATILQQLVEGVNRTDKKRGKLHEVWEDSFDWKECRTLDFVIQKLNYMHNNPCSGKWALAANPYSYVHSSAAFYITAQQGNYPVTNFMELEDIDLNSSMK